jgi:tetratricopeptide (TPR) repeat protein
MRKLFQEVEGHLKSFISQRDDLALIVPCPDDQAILVHKTLEGIDDASTTEMFWIFTEDFIDPHCYAGSVIETFAATHGAVSLAMSKRDVEPWPPIPPPVFDMGHSPADRLRHLMQFSRSLLPDPDGLLAVWCLFPLSIVGREAFSHLIGQILQHEFPRPWCHHLRFIVRAEAQDPAMEAIVGPMPRVAWYVPDLSSGTLQEALEEETDDDSLPLEERLQSLLVSAQMDFSHRRYDQALTKYAVLLKYYAGIGQGTMAAVVLNGIGEVHHQRGDLVQAGRCFEAAVEPASEASGPPVPVLLNTSLNLGNLKMQEGEWLEAEGYYDAAQQFATVQRVPDTKLRAIHNLGLCQYYQGKIEEALNSWHAGATVAEELEMADLQRLFLERLLSHYAHVGDSDNRRLVERKLVGIPSDPTGPEGANP